ncbi:hypothetical protein OROHE_013330 [Orobanche hederae]
MEGLNTIPEDGKENARIWPETKPVFEPPTLKINVSHGLNDHEVAVPSNSSFGDLKSVIVQKFGLNPETHKLLFRGTEKEDDEDLQTAGVKDNSKVLLMENMTPEPKKSDEVKESEVGPHPSVIGNVISRGAEAIAEIRKEVDNLADQVSALQAVVDSGTKVDDKYIIYLTEMLMRQLLKLDGIEAEGEGKVQRKMEVRRVQNFVEAMDVVKLRNSNSFVDDNKTASVTVSCPSPASTPLPIPAHLSSRSPSPSPIHVPIPVPVPSLSDSPMPSSAKVTEDWEHFD